MVLVAELRNFKECAGYTIFIFPLLVESFMSYEKVPCSQKNRGLTKKPKKIPRPRSTLQ